MLADPCLIGPRSLRVQHVVFRHLEVQGGAAVLSRATTTPGVRRTAIVPSGLFAGISMARRGHKISLVNRIPFKRRLVVELRAQAQQTLLPEQPESIAAVGEEVTFEPRVGVVTDADEFPAKAAGTCPHSEVGDGSDIVQFDAAVYYCEESSQQMTLDVNRLGTMRGTISVDYATEDGSAIAGRRYQAVSGTIVFKSGEVCKSIAIPIIDGPGWNTTLEFKVRLRNPQHCELGVFLYLSRVKVIDKDTFPTNKYQNEIRAAGPGNLEQYGVSGFDLFIEWCKLNLSYDGVAIGSLATLAIDQLHNLYFLLTTFLIEYVTDDVFGDEPTNPLLIPGSEDDTIRAVAALYLVPLCLLNLLDLWKANFGIAEKSRAELQSNVFRKFMNYDEKSRSLVSPSQMSLIMVQDVEDIVESGFMNMFKLAQCAGKLVVSSYFILASNPNAVGALLVFGVGSSAFVAWRYKRTVDLRERISRERASILEVVQESVWKYELIAEYYIRPKMQKRLQRKLGRMSRVTPPIAANAVTTEYFPNWITTALVTSWMILGSSSVMDGSGQVGTYLATISVFKEVGDSFKDIFTALLEVSRAIAPMQKITTLLNLQTNLLDLKAVSETRRRQTKVARSPQRLAQIRANVGLRYGTDEILIAIKGMSFTYPGSDKACLHNVNLKCKQGDLVAVLGGRGSGKATLMKLLGQVLLPTEGQIFVPSNLRVLHVSSKPCLLAGDVWENLAVGRYYWRDADWESRRVVKICKRLGCSSAITDRLEETRQRFLARDQSLLDDTEWRLRLSMTDVMLIHLARAFIYCPEVLVLDRPTGVLSPAAAERFYDMLSEFVEKHGVELPESNLKKRRPRTVFVSFARLSGARRANRVWMLEDGGVRELQPEFLDDVSWTSFA